MFPKKRPTSRVSATPSRLNSSCPQVLYSLYFVHAPEPGRRYFLIYDKTTTYLLLVPCQHVIRIHQLLLVLGVGDLEHGDASDLLLAGGVVGYAVVA